MNGLPEIRARSAERSVTVLELLGEHDMANADQLRGALEQALQGSAGVVVDLSRTAFIDSAVVHVLFAANAMLQERGSKLVILVAWDSTVRPVIEITNLTAVAAVVEDPKQALAAAARP